jgi:hypothetical protein
VRFLVVLLLSVSALAQTAPRKVPTKPAAALAISPYFAQRAFSFKQSLERLRGESIEGLIEGDYYSSPFEIQYKVLTEVMDRAKMFELRTAGDRQLFGMLENARLFINHDSLLRSYSARSSMSHRSGECLSAIQLVIEQRFWKGDGQCTYSQAVQDTMNEEEKTACLSSHMGTRMPERCNR